jgi:glycine cleavage system H protein
MESMLVFFGGLAVRLALFVLLFAVFATPIALVVFAAQGVGVLHARNKGTVDAGGVNWKPGVIYTAAHSWMKRVWGRTVKVGLDDVARRILSGASVVTLPPVGTRLRRGDVLAAVRAGARLVTIPSPVDGIVLSRNRELMRQPALLDSEPYRAGWMLRLEVDGPVALAGVSGADSRTWLRDENSRLTRFLESRLGMAAADGGTLTAPPSALLGDDAWREAAESFLHAS